MADSSGGGAINTHLGEEYGEVSSLEFLALFSSKACSTQWVLDHHAPDCTKSDSNVFSAEWCLLEPLCHLVRLLGAVGVFIIVITIRGKTDA
jgi:hypothetical protein